MLGDLKGKLAAGGFDRIAVAVNCALPHAVALSVFGQTTGPLCICWAHLQTFYPRSTKPGSASPMNSLPSAHLCKIRTSDGNGHSEVVQ
jgi:hypothetical protein